MKRRQFLQTGTALGAVACSGAFFAGQSADASESPTDFSSSIKQPPLPYALNALEPFLTSEQMNYHYNKHHAGYYTNLKKLLDGKPEAKMSLEEIVRKAEPGPLFNNAAQAWNHAFFWNCMVPPSKRHEPGKEISDKIRRDFGDMATFRERFASQAVGVFGSGWCWLTTDADGKLSILPTSNADCPQKHGMKPLLVVDVWEHAYYVDYRNDRGRFVKTFLEHVHWDFVAANMSR